MSVDWKVVGQKLVSSLPVLATALGGPLAGVAGGVVANLLGVEESPQSVLDALSDPAAVERLKISEIEANEKIQLAYLASETERLKAVNLTMRNEANSFDPFVRRWRPFYGYCLAVTWTIQMIMTTYYIGDALTNPEIDFATAVAPLMSVYTILAGMWTVALTVLGVSVHNRTKDKQVGLVGKAAEYLKG